MTQQTSTIAPGLYGSESSIEIDVSRPPRSEEYFAEIANPLAGNLTDVPSDTKNVSYYVQAPRLDGIQDPLVALTGSVGARVTGASPMQNGGLVRRSIDRSTYQWAAENGRTTQISRTGQLVAPEILAISFNYFNGQQWTTTWDGSAQGVPWAVRITIFMQHAKAARENPMTPGVPIRTLLTGAASAGIESYSLIMNVPGAQSLLTPEEQASLESGGSSSSETSSLGF
jgi:hypothetical protein